MSTFNINNFGSLTLKSGIRLKFEDFDRDNNGIISEDEYNAVLNDMKLDKVELSLIDTSSDKNISKKEFTIWEQKILMQQAVNELAVDISKDFAGQSKHVSEVFSRLYEQINVFAKNYNSTPEKMAQCFISKLPQYYESIKNSILESNSNSVKSKVIELVLNSENIPNEYQEQFKSILEVAAENFIKSYTGTNLNLDLEYYLKEYLNTSDSEKMQNAVKTFSSKSQIVTDLKELKVLAEAFLSEALEKGVVIKLGGTQIRTSAAIKSALLLFNESEALKAALDNAIAALSTESLKKQIIENEKLKAIQEEEKKFTDINGEEYKINLSSLDLTVISGYIDDTKIHERGKGWDGSKDKAYSKGVEILNTESLKTQMKSQIEEMLKAKGVPFSKIANVFENVYNNSVVETLNTDGMITGRGARGLSSKGHAYISTQQCVNTFLDNFNKNIANAINDMNAFDYDFDTIDMDLTKLNTGISTVNNDDIVNSYKTGQPLVTKKHGADYYVNIAEQIIQNLREQLLNKAKNMCAKNGVKFDQGVFDTLFKNIKTQVVDASVAGCNKKGDKVGAAASAATGVATGTAVTLGLATEAIGAVTSSAWTCSAAWAAVGTFTIPVLGWALGGALLAGGLIASIIYATKDRSVSVLNTRGLIDGFNQAFSETYSNWINEEKTKTSA